MNKNPMFLALVGAVLAGVIAVVIAAIWLGNKTEEQQVITIVQAAVNIEPDSKLVLEQLATVPLAPGSAVPQGAIFNTRSAVGRQVKTKIAMGEAIIETMLVPLPSGEDLSNDIPIGKRAFTIGINEISGVGGFASPGNYVDVIVNAKDTEGMPVSKTVVEHVKVMAVAQARSLTDLAPKLGTNVTLEVTPDEAQKLDVARSLGTLSLSLRNRADKKNYAGAASSKNDLILTPNSFSSSTTIEIIRGNLAPGSFGSNSSTSGGDGSSSSGAMGR
jgi:pilus assembly protein CpaB